MINSEINDLISELILKLKEVNSTYSSPQPTSTNILDDDIEVQADSGTPIKIDSRTFYKMVYADINNLKRDSESLLNLYLKDIKPTLKMMSDDLKSLDASVVELNGMIDDIKKNQPKSFKNWIEEKGNIANNISSFGKFIFYFIVILFMISISLPNVLKILYTMFGG